MIDHIGIQVADVEASLAFYLRIFAPIGMREMMRFPHGDAFVVGLEVAELRGQGVVFQEYDSPELRTVNGIGITPAGKGAWFKDSEGNVFTMMQLDTPRPAMGPPPRL